jgi:hypothetical protein
MRQLCVSAPLFLAGMAIAQQIPDRNCMSDPFMGGCPAEVQAREMQEKMKMGKSLSKGIVANPSVTPTKSAATVATRPAPSADSDWQRPRLATALPPDWPRWTFAPSDTNALIGIKLAALMKSPLLRQIMKDVGLPPVEASVPQPEEVWMALRPNAARQMEAVMLILGPDIATIASDLRSKGATVCFLDTQSILVGEWSAVNRALQRVIRPAAQASPFAKRARELWTSSDLWFIASGTAVATFGAPAGVAGISMGVSLKEQIVVDMLLSAATPDGAARLNQNPADLGLPAVEMKKVGNSVSIHGTVETADIPEAFRKQITDQLRPLVDLVASRKADGAKNAIVIQGLDDGPRVIVPKK